MSKHAPFDPRETLPALTWIVPDILAMGRRPESYIGFDLVVSCERHLARKPMDGYLGLVLHVPMEDEDDFPLGTQVERAARIIDGIWDDGGMTLVHCTGGLNRSGVVVAKALMLAWGITGEQALGIIRAKRDPYCVCNRAFERWITGERLPTAETSTFRTDA